MHRKLSVSILLTSDEIHLIANDLHLNCAEYGLQKWFNPPQRVRVKRFTYSHSVTKTYHDSLQVMKFVYWHSTNILSVLNIGLNITCAKSRNLCVYAWLTICIEYGLETWLANRDEIIVLELVMQLIGNQNSLRTWFRRPEDIRVLTLQIQPIFSVYAFDTLLALNKGLRVYGTDI